jgi:hypothetical protein
MARISRNSVAEPDTSRHDNNTMFRSDLPTQTARGGRKTRSRRLVDHEEEVEEDKVEKTSAEHMNDNGYSTLLNDTVDAGKDLDSMSTSTPVKQTTPEASNTVQVVHLEPIRDTEKEKENSNLLLTAKKVTMVPQTPMPMISPRKQPRKQHHYPLTDITKSNLNQAVVRLADTLKKVSLGRNSVMPMPPASPLRNRSGLDTTLISPQKVVPHQLVEVTRPIPRLVISKLVLINFKSYAGRQEIGPFHSVSFKFSFS